MKYIIFQFKSIYQVENIINDKILVELNSDQLNYNDLMSFFMTKIQCSIQNVIENLLFIFNNERFSEEKVYNLENNLNMVQIVLKKDENDLEQKLRVMFNLYGFDSSELHFNRENLENLRMEKRQKLNIEKLKTIQEMRNNLVGNVGEIKEQDDDDIFVRHNNPFIRDFNGMNLQNNQSTNRRINFSEFNEVKEDEEINKPIPLEEIKFNEEIIEKSNNKTIELFKNDNFKTLLKIFNDEPDVFKTFASYITHGDVQLDYFDDIEETSYDNELEAIKSLEVDINDELIMEALKRFKGHINLSLRYLLTNSL